ncbi:serine/threonine-protein kinase [Pseudoxanthomonas japonensis]|uniref:serine/threonine-protein kinase n=1 Tax=Pseudoxanthomonas japonensis TaxID=69284 RepID=UPI0028615E33|nr:serine/threonine-protein kinase [Pseudoxanthomonas japonensis]MDR7069773.1 serine/threonine-protein kinase [Pseudoxanthomonas japonensis]
MSTSAIRALALFDEYTTLPPIARAEALASLARDDPDTHGALSRLLASDAAFDAGLQPDPLQRFPRAALFDSASASARDPLLGRRMGAWRIERLVSIGGMGAVYEAQRDDGQYQQRVALKCIRRELSSPRLIEGFLRERDTLAALDHPGIAGLIDGGVDVEGTPWFAMRYVQGMQIDAWCDQRRVDLRQRVTLLMQVCDALAYAHAHDVLHQDIKPSNVMVTEDGQAQLLDFGLTASLTSRGGAPRLAMSHGYTAPEALSGESPRATADVWSLGRLMYCLLGGMLPLTRSPLLLAFNAQAEADTAAPPMSRLAATLPMDAARARGCTTVAQLARRLSGDLDAIALRATDPQPEARYASISELRADLQAWLQARPVHARQGGIVYRLARGVARHRVTAIVAAVSLATLAVAGGMATWNSRRLAHEAAETRALSQVFEQTLGTATLSGLGATPMSSHQLLVDAERRMRAMDLREHPDVQARGLAVLARNYMAIGDYARATVLAQEARALQRNDPASTAATLAALLNLQGKPAQAGQVAQAALIALDDDTPTPVRLQLLTEQARSQWHLLRRADAQQTLGEALALARQTGDDVAQAELLVLRGQWWLRQTRFAEAEVDLQAAIALSRDRAPLVANAARFVVAQNVMALGHMQEGHALLTRLLADYRRQLGDGHPLVGRTWRLLAHADCALGAFQACQAGLDRAEAIVRRDYGEQHPEYADLLRVRALASLFDPGSRVDGTALLRQADAILRAAYPPDHDDVQRVESMLARRLLTLPAQTPEARRRQVAEAIDMMEKTLALSRRTRLPLPALHRISLVEALMERDGPGDLAYARRLLDENTVLLRAYAPDFAWRRFNQVLDARLALRAGDLERADAQLSALEAALPQLPASSFRPAWREELQKMRADLTVRRGQRNDTDG